MAFNANLLFKTKTWVVRNLDDALFTSLRNVEAYTEKGFYERAVREMDYAMSLKRIRGYEHISDEKFDKVFWDFLNKFHVS